MEENKTDIYWYCNNTLHMKDKTIAFKEGEKYKQISIKNDNLILKNEKGENHHLSYDWRMWFECNYDKK